MDDNVRVRVSNSASRAQNSGDMPNSPRHNAKQKKNKLRLIVMIAGPVLLLIVLLFGSWLLYRANTGAHIDGSKYQAVFFANGQVYFGKLHKLDGNYMKLTDVFYLQTQEDGAKKDDPTNPQKTGDKDASELQLIKLGNEIHGPEDEMIISKEQILFYENLKKDSKVTDSIVKYHKQ